MNAAPKHDPLRPRAHDPNPHPPTEDPTIVLRSPDGALSSISVADLHELPQTSVSNCYIVSTGHGSSGPFTFHGVKLHDLIQRVVNDEWEQAEVLSADGFGNRVYRHELQGSQPYGPMLLAIRIDDRALEREDGLVRLIVPGERDDALRQVKWVAQINVLSTDDRASQ